MLSPGTEVEHNEHRTVLISHSLFKTLRIKMCFPVIIIKIMSSICNSCILIARIVRDMCFWTCMSCLSLLGRFVSQS